MQLLSQTLRHYINDDSFMFTNMRRQMSKEAKLKGRFLPDSVSQNDLKICDLCGRLNLVANSSCFVCGWRGHFDDNPNSIETCIELAVRQNGRLELHHLTDPETYVPPVPPAFPNTFSSWLNRIWGWLCR